MSKNTAKKLMLIWQQAITACLRSLLTRKPGILADDIAFNAWSAAIEEMYDLIPGETDWAKVSEEEKIAAMSSKFFSLENFKKEIFDSQMRIETTGTKH